MNRRTFLHGLAVAVPAAIGAGWLWRRGARSPASPPRIAAVATPGPPALAAASAGGGTSDTWAPRWGVGLPQTADPAAVKPAVRRALQIAERHITANCADLTFPNGAIHGVRALGRRLTLDAGDPFRTLLSAYVQPQVVGQEVFLDVPIRLEGHRHVLLKNLIEKRCEPDLEFDVDGGAFRFADLARSARALQMPRPSRGAIDEQAWSIIALVRLIAPAGARWQNAYGETCDLDPLIDATASTLRDETEMIRSIDVNAAELPRDCPILGRACGGLHMNYALACALASGYTSEARRADFAGHMRMLIRRFSYDIRVHEQVHALNLQRVPEERAWVRKLEGKLKFLGHALEVVGLVQQYELYAFDSAERDTIAAGVADLCATLVETEKTNLMRYKADRELYESLAGDMCHAYNGLLMVSA